MAKACRNCKFSKVIKYRYSIKAIPIRETMVCIAGPPIVNSSYGFKIYNVTVGRSALEKYQNYPKVDECAPCALYEKKSAKEIIKIEKAYKKEKKETVKKKEKEQEARKKHQEEQKALLGRILEAKQKERKENLQKKKKAKYQKDYRKKLKAYKLAELKELDRIKGRFEILDL